MKIITSIIVAIFPILSMGQLVTSTALSPTQLVQNYFQGPGVTISNVTYTGHPDARGSFTATGTNLGIAEGIILTTGTVQPGAAGPHGPNNQEGAGIDNGFGGYGPLTTLGGGQTYNAARLEFDFQTCSDSVSFNYVFASEEYLEYVQMSVNDVFGLFISGPGIAGSQNIATLPNGTPVAIDNIHSAGTNVGGTSFGPVNAQYYVNNASGGTIQYDGFTKKLKAETKVQCNQTYHLVIAIADVGDGVWDSGIFLEANSFTANSPVEIEHSISANVFNNTSILAEGCVSATVTFERTDCNLGAPMTIPITVSGTATEGVDFSNIANSVTFPAGSSQTQFTFDALQDGIAEGQESITFEFLITDNCGEQSTQTMTLFIQDIAPITVEITGDEVTCPGEEIELVATIFGGVAPFTYLWSTGETTSSIFVSPNSTQTYSVTANDACTGIPVTVDYEVVVPVIPPLALNPTADITEICPYIPALLESNASGGTPPYTYQWSSNFNPNLATSVNYTATPWTTTTYTVTVTDKCGNSTSEDILYTITSPPLVLTMSPAIQICPGDSVEISVSSVGGYGQHYYSWLHSGETTSSVWVYPTQTTSYTVIVSDECQTFTIEGSTQVTVVKPTADFNSTSHTFFNNLPITFQNLSLNATTYEWDFGDGNSSTFVHPSNTYLEPGIYYITLIAIDDKGCTDTITKPINIEEEWYIYVPNTFTPDGDRNNSVFSISAIGISELAIDIYNRWGELVFTAYDPNFEWDGTYNGRLVNDGTYTYKIDFTTNSRREKQITGHVNVLK